MAEYFLKIDGIAGESQDQQHQGEIEVESFSWGETHSAAAPGATAASKVNIQDLQVMKRMDKASPLLMLAGASGQHFKSAVLTAQTSGAPPLEFLTITLGDLMVASYQTVGSASAPLPVDQVSFSFGRIEIAYRPKRPDGTLDAPVTAGSSEGGREGARMPQPPQRRASKSTTIARMVSRARERPQSPAPAAKARREQSSLARATPAAIKDDQNGHRGNCGLTTKTPLRRSEAGAEQSSLSRDTQFQKTGSTATEAAERATLLICAAEGAVLLARARRSIEPLELIAEQLRGGPA